MKTSDSNLMRFMTNLYSGVVASMNMETHAIFVLSCFIVLLYSLRDATLDYGNILVCLTKD